MYYILTQDEYNKLSESEARLELFKDCFMHELELKRNDVQVYQQIKDNEDIVKLIEYEYSGMLAVKRILEKVMR